MSWKSKAEVLFNILGCYGIDLEILGIKAICNVNKDTVAEITLATSGRYDSLIVSIQNKTNGTIATNKFIFEEYLKRLPSNNNYSKDVKRMYIWDDRGEFGWYIVEPKATKPIVDAILKYIELYN